MKILLYATKNSRSYLAPFAVLDPSAKSNQIDPVSKIGHDSSYKSLISLTWYPTWKKLQLLRARSAWEPDHINNTLSQLISALADPCIAVRLTAIDLLSTHISKRTTRTLVSELRNTNPLVRQSAAFILDFRKPKTTQSTHLLINMLFRPPRFAQNQAYHNLSKLNLDHEDFAHLLAMLFEQLENESKTHGSRIGTMLLSISTEKYPDAVKKAILIHYLKGNEALLEELARNNNSIPLGNFITKFLKEPRLTKKNPTKNVEEIYHTSNSA